jgi:hypothetical protein
MTGNAPILNGLNYSSLDTSVAYANLDPGTLINPGRADPDRRVLGQVTLPPNSPPNADSAPWVALKKPTREMLDAAVNCYRGA